MTSSAQSSRIIEDTHLYRMLQSKRGGQLSAAATFCICLPHIKRSTASCIMKLRHTTTNEFFAAKILLPLNDGMRNYTTRKTRHDMLRQCAMRSFRFAPEGICVGLRPVLQLEDDLLSFGPITEPDKLDVHFEYVWFMHLMEAGESIDQKLQRNVAILQPLADTLHKIHAQSDLLDQNTAWRFASPEKLQQKFLLNLSFFEKMLPLLRETMPPSEWQALWPQTCSDQLARLSETVFKNETWQRTLIRRIEKDAIRNGHGDLKTRNIWFSDYYRSSPVRNFTECLTFFDPIDFDDRFSTIDILSEAAMLLVDIQCLTAPVDSAYFMYFYVNALPSWSKEEETVLLYYMMEKALVTTYVSCLFYDDMESARQYLWLVRTHLHRFSRLMATQNNRIVRTC